jgi:dipeptidyl aminopeptidase/acylaminoacyl peptidase
MWVDVCLNEEVILRRVRLSTEDQLRFSRDGSTWAVQAQDEHGGKFIALRDRTIRLEGEVVQWLGNRDFSHIAVVSRHQGEDHLAIDGAWRSSYHHIRDLRLSEDGLQWAYVAMKFSPEDALEYPAGERVVTQDGPMPICQEVLALELAPQGGRAAWVAAHPGGRQEVVTGAGQVWQTPPVENSLIQSLTLSDDGRRLAWAFVAAGTDPVFHLESGGSWELPVGASGESPTVRPTTSGPPSISTRICFSTDGWHAVFAASGRSSALMSEGGAISRHSIILLDSLTLSPDGRRLAYVAMEPVASAGNPSAQLHHASLWLDGKLLLTEENAWARQSAAGNRITMAGISALHFSPDGSRLACLRSIPQSSGKGHIRQAWLDGRIIPEKHDHALALAWTDSEILSLASVHSENDSIERVDHPPTSIR